jgi:GTPase SAR1 family protein
MSSSSAQNSGHDLSFKILLIGDSGVGKSCLLLTFISNSSVEDLTPTIGIYFSFFLNNLDC